MNPGCTLNCVFCGGKQKVNNDEIKKQEILAYKNILDFKKENLKRIEISGSDPLEYDKIAELIYYLRKNGFDFVQLSTNGVKLSDKRTLDKIISSGVSKLRVPIYGSNAKVHDSVTRNPGSFDKIVSGIENLIKKSPKTEIQVSCLVMKQNKNDLYNIVDFVNGMGIKEFYFSVPGLVRESEDFYIPFKDLGFYVKKLYKYALKINKKIFFLEIPFCVFGEFNPENIKNFLSFPPNLGKYNQPPKIYRTSTPDLPSYRVKRKIEMCNGCKAFDRCDGFFVNDIDKFGTGKIKKI